MSPECLAVLAGAGDGLRLGRPEGKALTPLAGRPLFLYALGTLVSLEGMRAVAIVLRSDQLRAAQEAIDRWLQRSAGAALRFQGGGPAPEIRLVTGGPNRQASVRLGLEALASSCGEDCRLPVLVHDAARPLASKSLLSRVLAAIDDEHAVAPSVALTDSLRIAERTDGGSRPLSRDGVIRVQTPQGWIFARLLAAHRDLAGVTEPYTDDLGLAHAAGARIRLVAGEERNLKVTTPEGLELARDWLPGGGAPRTGIGFDVHPLVPGEGVRIAGVTVPCGHKLAGHSDADVAAHAVIDALLGAAAMGDIGCLFPPDDPRWSGADSMDLLRSAWPRVEAAGYRLVNLDVSVMAEFPRLSPHYHQMCSALAEALGCDQGLVNVKATTCERLGPVGRGEGIAALATAVIIRICDLS